MDYSDFSYTGISSLLISFLPECPKIKADGNQIASRIAELFSDLSGRVNDKNSDIEKIVKEHLNEDVLLQFFRSTDLYQLQLPEIFDAFEVLDTADKIKHGIQTTGATYLLASVADNFGKSINGIKKRLLDIRRATEKLESLLQLDPTTGIILAGVALSEVNSILKMKEEELAKEGVGIDKTKPWSILPASKYFQIQTELEYLLNLEGKFENTWLAKQLQYGKSGPKRNVAIVQWIGPMVAMWVLELGRDISYSENQNSGREKFLQFAEACFQELHPTLIGSQPDVIRNAYERLRSEGKFDYLKKNEIG